MADQSAERLLAELEAGFEGALERAEDLAADDLALSLLQGGELSEALSRGSTEVVTADFRAPVGVSGPDYVITAEVRPRLVPFTDAIFVSTTADRDSVRSRNPALEVLRKWARRSEMVEIGVSWGTRRGRLKSASRDHLKLDAEGISTIVPLSGLRWIRLCREGSADEP